MIGQGQLRVGSGKYTSIHGIDALYFDYAEFAGSGFASRSAYVDALSQGETTGGISILESKWRRDFSMNANPESLLGRGIKTEVDEETIYLRQMSGGWIDEVIERLLARELPAGDLLKRHGYFGGRYINILNAQGQSILWRLP